MEKARVFVAIPSRGSWEEGFGMSLVSMAGQTKNAVIDVGSATSSLITKNRNRLVANCLNGDYTHILFLDDDMRFPPHLLDSLLEHDVDFVGCNCVYRQFPIRCTALNNKHHRIPLTEESEGLQAVKRVGLAIALIKVDVLKKLTKPYFMLGWNPVSKEEVGEDYYFCNKLEEQGVVIHVDNTLSKSIDHIGKFNYNWNCVDELKL